MSPAISMFDSAAFLNCCVTLAVWSRSAQRIEQNVQVANHGDEECVMNSDMVGNYALNQRNDRAAHNSHIQNARTVTCQRPEFGDSKTEYAGEHDGVEKSDCQNAPHGDVSAAQHRNDDQGRCADGTHRQQVTGSNSAQYCRSEKAAHHGAAPIE